MRSLLHTAWYGICDRLEVFKPRNHFVTMSLPARTPPAMYPPSPDDQTYDPEAIARLTASAPHLGGIEYPIADDSSAQADEEAEAELVASTHWESRTPIPYVAEFTNNDDLPGGPVAEFPVYTDRARHLLNITIQISRGHALFRILERTPDEVPRFSRQLANYTYQTLCFLELSGETHESIVRAFARTRFVNQIYGSNTPGDPLTKMEALIYACYQLAQGVKDLPTILEESQIHGAFMLQLGVAKLALKALKRLSQLGVPTTTVHDAMAYRWMGFNRSEALERAQSVERIRQKLNDLLAPFNAEDYVSEVSET